MQVEGCLTPCPAGSGPGHGGSPGHRHLRVAVQLDFSQRPVSDFLPSQASDVPRRLRRLTSWRWLGQADNNKKKA